MSATLQEWMLEQISNHELEKWLCDDNPTEVDLPLKYEASTEIHSGIEDIWMKENDYWLEEIPLFEEIQPLEELKNQLEQGNEDKIEKQNLKNFFNNDQNTIATRVHTPTTQPQDLFTTSVENTTLFLTDDNILYIRTDPNGDFASLQQEKDKTFCLFEENAEAKSSQEKIEMEVGVVDEIIRNTAMEINQFESDLSPSEVSFDSCETSEASSNMTPEEESDDPEWRPEVLKSSPSKKTKNLKTTRTTSRTKSEEDRANRKKEQNKNAATRYRLKKKAEVHNILREEEELKAKKAELTEKVFDIENEIKCLKGIMRDLFKVKGLI